MTLVSRISACALAALLAIPVAAQTNRHRAVSPIIPTGPVTPVTITAKDATNGVPVEDGIVTYAGQTLKTNASGVVFINLPIGAPALVTIDQPAFNTFSQTFTAQAGGKYDVTLTEKASVTVKTTTNQTHIVDIGTAQFAYAVTFSGYVRNDQANFCKQDGSAFTPNKTEFTRIAGPAVPATAPACCEFGSVMSANVEMKSGAKLLVYFKDSCSGDEVDFVGREKSTGRYLYMRFTDIAEIDFP